MSLQGKVDLKLTPFSIESMARSRFYDYETDEKSVRFGKMIIPKRLGFVDYTGMEDQLRKAFPNSTVIAFSESWAFNVNIMASYTRSVRTGDKVRIDYGNYSYMENMFQAGEILQDVMEQLEPKTSMCGYEWASWLYHTLWKSKVDLMGYLAQVFAPPESKMTLVDKVVVWNRPLEIDTFKIHVAPNKAEEFLPLMQRYQLIRGQNSSPRSAMTYSMYGSDFGPDMALAEDLSGFRHYLDYLKDIGVPDGSKILYHSDSERALMCAAVILKKYKYMLHHTQNFVIEGFSGATDNAWDLSSVYVYDPNQISDNGFTVNNEKSLEKYRAKQKKAYEAKQYMWRTAKLVAITMHIIGYESSCICLPAPHNMIGVLVIGYEAGQRNRLWNTCMLATIYRCIYYLVRIPFSMVYEVLSKQIDLEGYGTIGEIPFVKYTKAQKRIMQSFLDTLRIDTLKLTHEWTQAETAHIEEMIKSDGVMSKLYSDYTQRTYVKTAEAQIGLVAPPSLVVNTQELSDLSNATKSNNVVRLKTVPKLQKEDEIIPPSVPNNNPIDMSSSIDNLAMKLQNFSSAPPEYSVERTVSDD